MSFKRTQYSPVKTTALFAALLLTLTAIVGCGGLLEEDKRAPGKLPSGGGPPFTPKPGSTPTPVATPPGDGGVGVDRIASGVFGFIQTAGEYEISIQISDASLGLGHVESDGGNYTVEPQFIGVRKSDQ